MDEEHRDLAAPEKQTPPEEAPPFAPDPDLITYRERKANPEAMKLRERKRDS